MDSIEHNAGWPEDEAFAAPMSGESDTWRLRFIAYCQAGPSRSRLSIYNAERRSAISATKRDAKSIPSSWRDATQRFEWTRRAKEYDAWLRSTVFKSGNAHDLERIRKFDVLAEQLYQRIITDLNDIPVNDKLLERFIAVMDALAKLTGGYPATRIEHTGKDGKAIEVEERSVKVVFYMPEIEPLPDDAAQPVEDNTTGEEQ